MKHLKALLVKHQDIFFPVFDVLLNGLNFFMHIYISWFISLNNYSILSALLSLLSILFVMGISIQTYTTKEVSKDKEDQSIIPKIFVLLGIIMVGMNLLLLAFTPFIMKIMRADFLCVIVVILIFNMNVLLSFFRGVLQSRQLFLKLNISFYIEVLSKLIFIVAILPFFSGALVPLLGILVGMSLSLIHSYQSLGMKIVLKKIDRKVIVESFSFLSNIIGSNFFLYYLTSVGVMVANYYIGEDAAVYAVSLKFSQLILAVGLSVITVLVSYSSHLISKPKEFIKYINKWMIRFCFGGIVIIASYQFIVRYMITFLFGEGYSSVKNIMVIQAFAYVMLTIAYFIISIMIIMNQKIHIYILAIISALLTIALIVNHETIQSIITIEVVSFSLLFIGLLGWFIRKEKALW